MVLDGQKVRTDGGRMDGMGGRTHGRRHFYIPLTSSGDKKKRRKNSGIWGTQIIILRDQGSTDPLLGPP